MESSAKGLLQVQNWVKLKRDKSNVPWQRAVMEVLEAVGCEAAITEDFAKLQLFNDEDYDSKSSGDDSDDFLSKPRFPSPMQRQRTPSFRTFQPFSTSSMQAMSEDKRREKAMKKIKKMRKKEQEYEKMKKKMDAKARTIIRNSIDAKAFERSTYDCKTAML